MRTPRQTRLATGAFLVTVGVLLTRVPLSGQKSPDGLWTALPDTENAKAFSFSTDTPRPQTFRLFQLDGDRLATQLRNVRFGLDADAPRLSFPLPDATFVTFRVEETQTMSPALAKRNPDLKTYRGEGVEDPSITVRFENVKGAISALIFAPTRRVYISPVQQDGVTKYIAYSRESRPPQDPDLGPGQACLLDDERATPGRTLLAMFNVAFRADPIAPGAQLRTYRLAVGATGEYTRVHGKTVEDALAAIVATISRVNEVYQKEVAVRFELVDDEDKLIKIDPEKDGYSNGDPFRLVEENQKALDSTIGSGAYDIGHVFATAGGGYAPGFACRPDSKAEGATGRPDPRGDPFNIDYVAHELGHQLSANHTFNSTTGHCRARHAATAYEPGGGSTIMAYAGLCGSENLQNNSHPYFHVASLDEIAQFVTVGAGARCGSTSGTSNHPPAATVRYQALVIPRSTPFELSGSASDPDGDRIQYGWEQMDTGYSAPPNDDVDGLTRPLFRSLEPSSSSSRTFPAIEHLAMTPPVLGDTLPSIVQTLRFRLTARDGRASGGSFGYAETRVSVASTGPFQVTAPAANTTWNIGSKQGVKWDVAATDKPPIGIASVRIALSIDGGTTYPHELLHASPNTGSAAVVVPKLATTKGRVRVEAVDGGFFNVSAGHVTIR
jgi:Metallo-peptidase family M12B Reprolysin-like